MEVLKNMHTEGSRYYDALRSEKLLVGMMEAEVGDGPVVTYLVKGLSASYRSSVETRLLREILCSSFKGRVVERILEEYHHNGM